MEMRPLLEAFERIRALKIPFHHVNEAIVVLSRASRILHQKRPGFPQTPAHGGAQCRHLLLLLFPPASTLIADREVGGKVDDGELHESVMAISDLDLDLSVAGENIILRRSRGFAVKIRLMGFELELLSLSSPTGMFLSIYLFLNQVSYLN